MKSRNVTSSTTSTAKTYIVTVVFEAQNENDATLAFQNAACQINAAAGCEPLEIAHIKEVLNGNTERPTLQTIQVLNPEDFSTWESVREARTFGNGMPRKAKGRKPMGYRADANYFAGATIPKPKD